MKTRSEPLKTPSSPRYWILDLKVKDTAKSQHTFRHPYYGVAGEVMALVHTRSIEPEADIRSLQSKTNAILPVAGLLIGVCWWNLTEELESVLPLDDLTEETMLKYGHQVAEEMQDAGYDLLHLMEMFGRISGQMLKRQSLLELAQAQAVFSAAPADA